MHETHIIPDGYTFTISADIVRHDNRLSKGAKLLYLDIYQLSQTSGICTAGNEKFMDFLGDSKRNIQRFIKELYQYGYITVKVKNITERIITIVPIGKQDKYSELYSMKQKDKEDKQTTNMSLMSDKDDAHERQECRHNNINKYYKDINKSTSNCLLDTSVKVSSNEPTFTDFVKTETVEKEIAESNIDGSALDTSEPENNTNISALDNNNSVSHSANAESATCGNSVMTDKDLESKSDVVQDSVVSTIPDNSDRPAVSLDNNDDLFSDVDTIVPPVHIDKTLNQITNCIISTNNNYTNDMSLEDFDMLFDYKPKKMVV